MFSARIGKYASSPTCLVQGKQMMFSPQLFKPETGKYVGQFSVIKVIN